MAAAQPPSQKSFRVTVAADGLPQQVYTISALVSDDAGHQALNRYAEAHGLGLFDGPRVTVTVEEV